MTAKRVVISVLLGGLVLGFLGVLALAILREAPDTNSYALLAEGWLNGRFDSDQCFDTDCGTFNGLNYVVFPPLPGVIVLPFVALFGVDFHFFLPLSILAFALSGLTWWRIVSKEAASRDLTLLLVLAILFATPLAFVALRGDHVWFFAQSWGFLFSSAALYFALVRRNALLTGLFIGAAFLSRQMTILYLPFLYILLVDEGTPWWRIDGAAIRRALTLAIFPLIAILIYFAYNYLRFGSILETGYSYILQIGPNETTDATGFIGNRVREIGLFSRDYLVFNLIYMFLNGPHVEFVGHYLTELGHFDSSGASLFLVTPALLFAFLAKWDRSFWFGVLTAGLILVLTLFYHSNGYSQYSAQRYALDWLPILFIFLARGVKPDHAPPLSLLTFYSMFVTLGMIAIGGLLAT